jgi:hypothetical protein
MANVQENAIADYNATSSETFRLHLAELCMMNTRKSVPVQINLI